MLDKSEKVVYNKGKAVELPIYCDCGKLVAKWRQGKLYVWCKNCRKEHEIKIPD